MAFSECMNFKNKKIMEPKMYELIRPFIRILFFGQTKLFVVNETLELVFDEIRKILNK